MKVEDLLSEARDTMTVKRVYGEPYQQNGITVIPAASIRGGGGAGEGEAGEGQPGGAGGGFGVSARPVGAYQIKGDEVRWVPAADTTKAIMASEVVLIVALLVIRSIVRTRKRRS